MARCFSGGAHLGMVVQNRPKRLEEHEAHIALAQGRQSIGAMHGDCVFNGRQTGQGVRQSTRCMRIPQQADLTHVSGQHCLGDKTPSARHFGHMRHREQGGTKSQPPSPKRTQGPGCQGLQQQRQAHSDAGQQQATRSQNHAEHGGRYPPGLLSRGDPEKARHLRQVPIKADGATEQAGCGDIGVSPHHQAQHPQRQRPQCAPRWCSGTRCQPQEQQPQGHRFGRESGLWHDAGRGPPGPKAEKAVQKNQGQQGSGPAQPTGARRCGRVHVYAQLRVRMGAAHGDGPCRVPLAM